MCVGKFTIIGTGNGLSPGRHQIIIWTSAGILSVGPLGTHFSEIWIEIHIYFHSRKCIWKFLRNVGHVISDSTTRSKQIRAKQLHSIHFQWYLTVILLRCITSFIKLNAKVFQTRLSDHKPTLSEVIRVTWRLLGKWPISKSTSNCKQMKCHMASEPWKVQPF